MPERQLRWHNPFGQQVLRAVQIGHQVGVQAIGAFSALEIFRSVGTDIPFAPFSTRERKPLVVPMSFAISASVRSRDRLSLLILSGRSRCGSFEPARFPARREMAAFTLPFSTGALPFAITLPREKTELSTVRSNFNSMAGP